MTLAVSFEVNPRVYSNFWNTLSKGAHKPSFALRGAFGLLRTLDSLRLRQRLPGQHLRPIRRMVNHRRNHCRCLHHIRRRCVIIRIHVGMVVKFE